MRNRAPFAFFASGGWHQYIYHHPFCARAPVVIPRSEATRNLSSSIGDAREIPPTLAMTGQCSFQRVLLAPKLLQGFQFCSGSATNNRLFDPRSAVAKVLSNTRRD
jgi:hypothetical protein